MRILGLLLAAGLTAAGPATAQIIQRVGPGAVLASDLDGPYDEPIYDAPPVIEAPRAAVPPPYPPPPAYGPTAYGPSVLAPREVLRIARAAGYSPLGAPHQRDWIYTVPVVDIDGEDGRLFIDARTGRIIRFRPALRYGSRAPDMALAYGMGLAGREPVLRPPASVPARRAVTPLPKPRNAAQPLPETTGALTGQAKTAGHPAVPQAPTAAIAAAPAAQSRPAQAATTTAPAAKPEPTILPTQPMPPAQGLD